MKSNLRNEIKSYIVRSGYTMQEVVDRLSEDYGWSDSVSNLSNKLQRESLRYVEAVQLADALGIPGGAIDQHQQAHDQHHGIAAYTADSQDGQRRTHQDDPPGEFLPDSVLAVAVLEVGDGELGYK